MTSPPEAVHLHQALLAAWDEFCARDAVLLRVGANERSTTHRLAMYLEPHFPGWHVDCEYNRLDANPKELPRCPKDPVPPTDLDARTVYPDIIVHKRRTQENLLVIEVKKATGGDEDADHCKLRHFTDPTGAYRYAWGLHLILPKKPDGTLSPTWFKDGKRYG
ncbi:MAG: hypothetical protein WD557_04455 [Dehalococcoidia bacterium]